MKISDVLFEAANERLYSGGSGFGERFSCNAVLLASSKYQECYFVYKASSLVEYSTKCPALAFLIELGCNPDRSDQFFEFKGQVKQQGARYLWLMFAYLVALDEERITEANEAAYHGDIDGDFGYW